jgi:hypothetical protein
VNLKGIETDTGESVKDTLDRTPDPEEVQQEARTLLAEVLLHGRTRRRS